MNSDLKVYEKDKLKEFLFTKDESLINDWFLKNESLNSENFRVFKAFFLGYFRLISNDLEKMEYLHVTKNDASLLFNIIDIYNENHSYIVFSDILNDVNNIDKLVDCLDEDNLNYLKKYNNNQTLSKEFLKSKLISIVDTISKFSTQTLISNIDSVIKDYAGDKIEGFVSHVCLYNDDIQNFIEKSFGDFIRLVKEDVIPFEKVKKSIGYVYNGKNYNNREEEKQYFIKYLEDIRNLKYENLKKDEWYNNFISKFIKLFREANLYKKYYHTIRVLYMTNLSCEQSNLSPFIKDLVMSSALQHDIGRFYQGAYHDTYGEDGLTNDEKNYGYDLMQDEKDYGNKHKIDKYTHPLVGYILGLNSTISFNETSKKEFNENFDIMSHIVSFVITIHQQNNMNVKFLDKVNINLLNSKTEEEIKIIIKNVVLKVYEIAKRCNKKLPKHKFSYDTVDSNNFYKEMLNSYENNYINNLLTMYKDEFSIIKEVSLGADIEDYDFSGMLKDLLRPITHEQLEKTKDPKEKKKLLELINYQEELKSIVDYEVFESLVNLASLFVMDIDKTDILVQSSNIWLDNENYKERIRININDSKKIIDLEEYLNLKNLGLMQKESIIKLLKECNPNELITLDSNKKIIIINFENKQNFGIYIPMELLSQDIFNQIDDTSILSPNSNAMKKIFFQKDILEEYLCINEHLGDDFEKFQKYKANMRSGNSLQIIWWRINEFIMRNTRIKSSLKMIKDIELLDQIYNHFNDLNPDFAVLIKPIIFVAKLYIDKSLERKEILITSDISKEIRKEVANEIIALYEIEYNTKDLDLDKLFELLIKKFDELKLKAKINIKQY